MASKKKNDDVLLIWNGEYAKCKLRYKNKRNDILEKWTMNKLVNIKDNVERIVTVRKHAAKSLEALLENIKETTYSKEPSTALALRIKGNENYKVKNFKSALRGYNLSLCFSPPKTKAEELSLAYANRSACFLELNRIEDCLKDIDSAWTAACFHENDENIENENLKKKLVDRRKKCFEKLKSDMGKDNLEIKLDRSPPPEFKLQSANSAIQSAEKFVTIENSPSRGRHVKVTQDVSCGDLLIVEEPMAKVLVTHLLFSIDRCDNCQRKLSATGTPCQHCVFAMYCDENCMTTGSLVHQYECKMSPYLHNMGLSRILLLALRIVTKLGPLEMHKFWKKNFTLLSDEHNKSVKNTDEEYILGFNEDGKYESSDYLTIFNLIYHDEILTERELCQYSLEAILMADLLKKHSNYFNVPIYDDKEEEEKFVNFIASVLLLHQMNLPCNAHSLNELKLEIYGKPTREEIKSGLTNDYGAGAFALLSLINHSCDPNVSRVTLANGHNAVVAIRNIKAGEEILDNYGPHYAVEKFPDRQKHLKSHYNFDCTCVACQFKWPSMLKMKSEKHNFTCVPCTKDLSLQSNYQDIRNCVLSSKGICPWCCKSYDLKLIANQLEKYGEKFNEAYELVLQNRARESVPILKECLSYFESQLLPPYVYSNYSQETLKQAFNLLNM